MNELFSELGLEVIKKNIEVFDIYGADEAFMTGTPFCMLPVTSLNGIKISDGKVGKIFTAILNQWSRNMGIVIPIQIKKWNNFQNNISNFPTPYKFKKNMRLIYFFKVKAIRVF